MIYEKAEDIIQDKVFLNLPGYIPHAAVFLKLECFNLGNSIKLKAARALIDDAELNHSLKIKRKVIESSSGNLGLALSIVCSSRGYDFTCVVDKNTLVQNIKAMKVYGSKVVVIDKLDDQGGYLASRLEYIEQQLKENNDLIWPNQYINPCNPLAHANLTAKSIIEEFPNVDYLFVGTGTAGTLMGCIKKFKESSPNTKIIAVDSIGSVTFGTPSAPRLIPGLGASVMPPFFEATDLNEVIQIHESETIETCHNLAKKYGYMAGGSTGTVLAAIKKHQHLIPNNATVVAISPDAGERYLDTIYCNTWTNKNFN